MAEAKETLTQHVRGFLRAKNLLVEAVEKIGRLVEEKSLSIFSSKRTLNTILWIHEVLPLFAVLEEE